MNNFQQFFRDNSDIDAFLVIEKENIFYLTGFRGSFGYLLVFKSGESFLITDSRYAGIAKNIVKKSGVGFLLFDKDFKENIEKKIPRNFQKLGIENSATLAQKEYWQELLSTTEQGMAGIEIVPQNKIIEKWRVIKNTGELQKVREACLQLDRVFSDIDFFRGILRAGVTEKEVAFQLEMKLRDSGKYKLSFSVIIAFGENSSVPHHKPGNRKLKSRENILIDCGVKFENYCSDMTRNFFLEEPTKEYLDAFSRLLDAQEKTLQEYKIGKKLLAAQEFCKQALGDLSIFFTHSLGHGVGLDIHELPSFSDKEQAIFRKGQVVTCEPGVYFPRKFGIRIEDQVLITADGAEILTKTPKELIIL